METPAQALATVGTDLVSGPQPAPARASAPKALILRGDGGSASKTDEVMHLFPDHELWSMNSQYLPGAARHFDVHYDDDQPGNVSACNRAKEQGAQVIISPFLEPQDKQEMSFPLEQIHLLFGLAFYQRTLCMMLALACYERRIGRQSWDVLCLPGHDYNGWPHFGLRDGPHLWCGVAAALGFSIHVSPGSSLLKRRLEVWKKSFEPAHDLRVDQPHCYGQPREITAPLAARYRWE